MKHIFIIAGLLVFVNQIRVCASVNELRNTINPDKKLSVMFYNVHNLFDTYKDPEKEDWTYLPIAHPGKKEFCETIENPFYKTECLESDWTEKKFQKKISQLTEAIEVSNPELPDLIGLCEIENEFVVSVLAKSLGYKKWIVANGPDKRGIDVALMVRDESKISVIKTEELEIEGEYFIKKPTRTILKVELLVDQKHKLNVYVNHWPSQGNPASTRVSAANRLLEDLKKNLDPELNVLLMGDFNTLDSDFPHPFKSVFFHKESPKLYDVFYLYNKDKSINDDLKKGMPLGTYFFHPSMEWNRLDLFFINEALKDGKGLDVTLSSYQILAHKKLTTDFEYKGKEHRLNFHYGTKIKGVPRSSSSKKENGYSDHFGIKVEFTYQ